MNETYVTLQGWVGGEVDVRAVGDTECASFRVGSTPRYLHAGSWVDGPTSWYTVNCWRTLGRNVKDSLRRGDAVVVHGRVRVDVWPTKEGEPSRESWVVDATFVGHDLTRGTATFTKVTRGAGDTRRGEPVREGPRADAGGEPVTPPAA